MNKKHQKTLQEIFKNPVPSNVKWKDIEALFIHLGAEVKEARGSRILVHLNGIKIVFHRPHPQRETDRGALVSVRKFLEKAKVYVSC